MLKLWQCVFFWKYVCVCVSFFVHHKFLCCVVLKRCGCNRNVAQVCYLPSANSGFSFFSFFSFSLSTKPTFYTFLWQHRKFNTTHLIHSQIKNEREICFIAVACVCIASKMVRIFFLLSVFLFLGVFAFARHNRYWCYIFVCI